MLELLQTALNNTASKLNFENMERISPSSLHTMTGLSHRQFQNVVDTTPSLQAQHQPNTSLAYYLMKIRSGDSNERISDRLGVSRRTYERHLSVARDCLITDFAPQHLGFNHINRDEIIGHALAIPDAIYNNGYDNPRAILIADGTYLTIQKSSNFLFQKKTYSLHKFKNLLKPLLIVCTDGYIVDITGPHAATTSDATIMSGIMNEEDAVIHYVLNENDVLILDRGFRDSIPDIEACRYDAYMPSTKMRHEEQLSTRDANKSRLVTIVRWVVEIINGRFKRDFKIFRNEYFNRSLPNIMIDFRIAASLLNAFRDPVQNPPLVNEIIRSINERRDLPNVLADYVAANNINRQRAAFRSIDIEPQFEFPRLTEEELILFSLGTYQIKLARSYVAEHMREDGIYKIELTEAFIPDVQEFGITDENITLLRCRVQSRHISRRIYYSYILYKREIMGLNNILQYCCSCLTGRRTLGCCAHIMCVIWFLGWARLLDHIPAPAEFLDDVIIDDFEF